MSITDRRHYWGIEGVERKKLNLLDFIRIKREGKKIAVLSVCDYPMALWADRAGVDVILVGDVLHMVALGYEDTISVTLDEMIFFSKAITKAARNAFVVGDMPFMTYEVNREEAVRNAGRFMSEGGVDAVKLEGDEEIVETVRAVTRIGIPVLAHIGFRPQKVMMRGAGVQGETAESAKQLLKLALDLEKAGAFMLLLETVAEETAAFITDKLTIPTIGMGAGPGCDGQGFIAHDLLGIYDRPPNAYLKNYVKLHENILQAFTQYKEEVTTGKWPDKEHTFHMKEDEKEKLLK